MSRTIWILVVSLGLAFIIAAYIGIRIGNSFRKRILSTRIINVPPNEYADLFKGADSSHLEFMKGAVPQYRNPVCRYRYDYAYEILETKLNLSATGRLPEKLEVVQAKIPAMGSTYEGYQFGRIEIYFKSLDQPDSSFKEISLIIHGRGVENTLRNDSVLSYHLDKGSFGISRSSKDAPDFYSDDASNPGFAVPSEQTALLLIRRRNALFILVASPIYKNSKIPDDLLTRLVGL